MPIFKIYSTFDFIIIYQIIYFLPPVNSYIKTVFLKLTQREKIWSFFWLIFCWKSGRAIYAWSVLCSPNQAYCTRSLADFSLLFVLLRFILWCHPILTLILRKKLIKGFSFLFSPFFSFPCKEGKLVRVMRNV